MTTRRTLGIIGVLLLLLGAVLVWAGRTQAAFLRQVRDADQAFARADLAQALRGYEAAQAQHARGSLWLRPLPWRRGQDADRLVLQHGNVRYRQAEALLATYGRARRDPEVRERPSIESIRQRFGEARQQYEKVSQADPVLYAKAQFNAAHASAMEFLIDVWVERAKSQSALRGDLVRLIRRVASVIDYVNARHLAMARADRMQPLLLLERLTQFSAEAKKVDDRADAGKKLGDFLKVSPPDVTAAERKLVEKFLLEREEPVQAGEGEEGGVH